MYKVSMVGRGSYISIIILVALFILCIQRIVSYKRGQAKSKKDLIAVIVLIGVTILMTVMLFIIPSTNKITIRDNELTARFASAFTKIEITSEDIIDARIIDWNNEKDYEPMIRNMGTSTGDFKEGKFTLRNGANALIYTNTSKVLLIKLDDRYLLLGPDDFTGFIEDFKNEIYQLNP